MSAALILDRLEADGILTVVRSAGCYGCAGHGSRGGVPCGCILQCDDHGPDVCPSTCPNNTRREAIERAFEIDAAQQREDANR